MPLKGADELKLTDSRRMTGPHLLRDQPGAILEIEGGDEAVARALPCWQGWARKTLDAVGWSMQSLAYRTFPGGASLFLSAPVDCLYAATEVNELAWDMAMAFGPAEGAGNAAFDEGVKRLREEIESEKNPPLMALREAAGAHDVCVLSDDDEVSVGMGRWSQTWPAGNLPEPGSVNWQCIRDIPAAFVTGTNGKTTTVRLLQAMVGAAGLVAGVSSTDYLQVGDSVLDQGDYSGPGGARAVLRSRNVAVAILETARGGLLRRGLAMDRAAVSLVTNVGEDHLGEYGIDNLADLARVKLIVAKGLQPDGYLVLNAGDPHLKAIGQKLPCRVVWFDCGPKNGLLNQHLEQGGSASYLEDDKLVLSWEGHKKTVATLSEVPVTFNGAARHNIANALGAIAVAAGLGLDVAAMRSGLRAFKTTSNPGRTNHFKLGGADVLVDFAHNPHGLKALTEMGRAMPAKRRLIVLGQAGDRSDEAIRELGTIAATMRPDCVIVKELVSDLRGRAPREVPALIEAGLLAGGIDAGAVVHAPDEPAAVERALAWAQPGDLLLLICHTHRAVILDKLQRLEREGWQPGT